jgi:hypothetical protein
MWGLNSARFLPSVRVLFYGLSHPNRREALNWCPIPRRLPSGEELVMEATYNLPEGDQVQPWYLDLSIELRFWFSRRGMPTVEVRFRRDSNH